MNYCQILEFYKDKRVFVTGHTGFKGTWLCQILLDAGAKVTGYSLEPPTSPSLFEMAKIAKRDGMNSIIGDVRDMNALKAAFDACQPEIVLHLAAQPLVIESYNNPHYTYETNVMGTVNLLECIRLSDCVKSVLNVTTDKVYYNDEKGQGFTEDMPLDGYDPYSNSKSCSELVTHSYRCSFLKDKGVAVATARAGNVIGGGDFAENRIVPDCVRAAMKQQPIEIRNPYSVRPFQHVLEPLFAYLMIAEAAYRDMKYADAFNVGPDESDCVTTGEIASLFCEKWGDGLSWINKSTDGPHEAGFLRLECQKLKDTFNWQPRWNIADAIDMTVKWSRAWMQDENIGNIMTAQISEYVKGS